MPGRILDLLIMRYIGKVLFLILGLLGCVNGFFGWFYWAVSFSYSSFVTSSIRAALDSFGFLALFLTLWTENNFWGVRFVP